MKRLLLLVLMTLSCKHDIDSADQYLSVILQHPYADLVYFSTLYSYALTGCDCTVESLSESKKDSLSNYCDLDMTLKSMDTTTSEVVVTLDISRFLSGRYDFYGKPDYCISIPFVFTFVKSTKKLRQVTVLGGMASEFRYNIEAGIFHRFTLQIKSRRKSKILDFVLRYYENRKYPI
ncbi:MAG: hypothetical protein ACOYOA_15180 [Saprospiraceae bacterium]